MEVETLLHRIRIRNRSGRRILTAGATVACLVGTALAPTTASASYTVTNGVYCNDTVSQVFSSFGDSNWYALAPGGDFEGDLSSWKLSGGAAKVAGSEVYNITGTAGAYSLQIPANGTATSASVCVDPSRETFRFFVRNASKTTKARLKVEALFLKDGQTRVSVASVGYVTTPIGVWQPSPILRNAASKYLGTSGTGSVQYRFTAENGAMQIDDLHIDPRRIR